MALADKCGFEQQIEKNDTFAKQVILILIKGIKPSELQRVVQQEVRTSDARTNVVQFFEILEACAVEQDRYHGRIVKTRDYFASGRLGVVI